MHYHWKDTITSPDTISFGVCLPDQPPALILMTPFVFSFIIGDSDKKILMKSQIHQALCSRIMLL